MPDFIKDLEVILSSHTSIIEVTDSLHILFTNTPYGCEKQYPVALVHEAIRIKEEEALNYFKTHQLLDNEGFTPKEYLRDILTDISLQTPKYIQNVGFMLSSTKNVPHPTFFNKFKHDYWKKISSIEGLEAVIDISTLTSTTSACEAEESLRSIIRKRKEVHQLKKIAFVWIVEVMGKNSHIETVMKHYFESDAMVVINEEKAYYIGWSSPLQNINMRYFVCPPE